MTTEVHTLSGAYALHALEPHEAEEFRRHLEGCPACREEVHELRRAAARLGGAEATRPPRALRERVLAAVALTPQLPPLAPTTTSRRPRRTGRWLAAAAAVVVAAGGATVGVRALVDDTPPLTPEAVRVFDAPDVRTATVATANGGEVTVGVSPGRDEMAVDTRRLPDPGEGRVYQIWSVHSGAMVSAAVLTDPEQGAAMGLPARDTQVAITVEPAGGSERPTSPPIVQVDPRKV